MTRIEEQSLHLYPQLYDKGKQSERAGWEKGYKKAVDDIVLWMRTIGKPQFAERLLSELGFGPN